MVRVCWRCREELQTLLMGQGVTACCQQWEALMSSARESAVNDRLRIVEESDLRRLLSWRNDVDVRRFMFTNSVIGCAEHCALYRRCMAANGRQLLIFQAGGAGRGLLISPVLRWGGAGRWGFLCWPGAAG